MTWSDYYDVTRVQLPEGVPGKVHGLSRTPDGRIAVAFLEGGRVVLYDPTAEDWQLYAEGLHTPMGLHVNGADEIVTAQRPELTRLRDIDGDDWAEHYDTITDEWGLSGPRDRFANGPAVDSEGNYYVGLGRPRDPVAYRGWVLKVTPDGDVTPIAPGFREPNGILCDSAGRILVTDQQGHWVGTSPLYHVQPGNFYGYPAEIVPPDAFEYDPTELSAAERNERRSKPIVEFPHGDLAVATTGLVEDTTGGDFGPFAGQLLVGDWVVEGLHRVMLQEVAGSLQGACAPGPRHAGNGAHRLTVGPTGDIWIGFTNEWGRSGTADVGLRRLSWNGTTPPAVQRMRLTDEGFSVRFTTPIDPDTAATPDAYSMDRYYYAYTGEYGSPKHDQQSVPVSDVAVGAGGREVSLTLGELQPGYVHALTLEDVTAADGQPLVHENVYYTLNRLHDGTTGDPGME